MFDDRRFPTTAKLDVSLCRDNMLKLCCVSVCNHATHNLGISPVELFMSSRRSCSVDKHRVGLCKWVNICASMDGKIHQS